MTLAELLARQSIALTDGQVAQLEWLAQELLHWNQRRNLTAITDRDQVLEKHLVDSLTLLEAARNASSLLDLGSGPGFPALPLKIACPTLAVVAVDASAKKIAFQRHVVRSLHLDGFAAVHARAEALAAEPGYRGAFDLVTARALGNLSLLVDLGGPFLAPGGRLVAMKGPEVTRELAEVGEPLADAGWLVQSDWFTLPLSGAARCLLILQRKDP